MKLKNEIERMNDVLSKMATKEFLVDDSSTMATDEYITLTEKLDALDKNSILFSDSDDEKNIDILSKSEINHLIGSSNLENIELETCLNKINSNDIWGIEKYLIDETQVFEIEIHHSKDIKGSVDKLFQNINTDSYFSSPQDNLHLIINELVMNSFYHQDELIDRNRKHSVINIGNAVTVRVGVDDNCIAVSVVDNIGTLTRDKVISSLKRSFHDKKPKKDTDGAGLGLYIIYQNVNQLHINVKKNEQTEVICLIDKNKRFKKFKERITSFHFYEEVL